MKFLIVLADFYQDISEELLAGAVEEIEGQGFTYHKITVPGALEIPPVISYACDLEEYDGFVALGCVIKGGTSHDQIVGQESARGLMDLAMNMNLAIGNGILTVNDKKQALERADRGNRNKGGEAAQAAIRLAKIQQNFSKMLQE